MRISGSLLAIALAASLVGCSASSSDPDSCRETAHQAAYETMRQLAAAGLASDPMRLRQADAGTIVTDSDDPLVRLPRYSDFLEYTDAEQAELLSALRSELAGVGSVFNDSAFLDSLHEAGPCAGQVVDH